MLDISFEVTKGMIIRVSARGRRETHAITRPVQEISLTYTLPNTLLNDVLMITNTTDHHKPWPMPDEGDDSSRYVDQWA